MKRLVSFLVLICVTAAGCAGSPLAGVFGGGPKKPTKEQPIPLTAREYLKKRWLFDGEILEEHRSADGTRLEGMFIPMIVESRPEERRLIENEAQRPFFVPAAELSEAGALLSNPIRGSITASAKNNPRGITLNLGSRDGIQPGYLFAILRFEPVDKIPIINLLWMYQFGTGVLHQQTGVILVKEMGHVVSVSEDRCEAETFGYRDLLGVSTGDTILFGIDDGIRYNILSRLPEAISFIRGKKPRLGPTGAKAWIAKHLARSTRREAVPFLINALSHENPDAREIAQLALKTLSGKPIAFDPLGTAAARAEAIAQWTAWWEEYRQDRARPWPPKLKDDASR